MATVLPREFERERVIDIQLKLIQTRKNAGVRPF